jgi:hypothetical protein
MDERILSDRFHEALEMEPRPGAYERMRFAMTNRPVVLKRRPAYRMRWSKMGLRIAAGLTAAVIVIAVAAAFIAAHRGLVGSAPAGQDPNVKAYRDMIALDYNTMAGSTSNHCNTIQDTGCEAGINNVISTLQKWVGDLNSFQKTPSQYVVIDGQLRRHLNQLIADGNAAVAFQKAGNDSGFNLAMNAGFYERAWIDPTMSAIVGSYPRVAATYNDAFRLTRQSLDACVNHKPAPADLACAALVANVCTGGDVPACESDVQSADTQIQTFLIALLQNPAPSSLSTKNAQLQADLAQADTALLATTDALLSGNAVMVGAGQNSYSGAIFAADADASAIGNP